ncbi:MAG: RluA family pseudouridine synthase [Candidatus Phytoplasma australasiaticum]|uniref:Pseudouridine synthase n=2 Tax=16SrII (Peanut WB group) TaxID=85621 RepID=A0A9K3ST26_9MOLU|nr:MULTISPECIES: RluA family pseudouridine synthase [Phytoplasma]MCG3566788.1 RluA family pseudouridine synthase [Sesame phyllody phytoplasma]MDO8031194.1 RluA family pseudouridine synthase [Candidatus Phytoplasma australasiaticum]MDO8031540.1 RluA family pseudouridine synthase [Candidatus Phytoplasma australasiaticum]MDO8031548.1 RluA family pseudouridine synthase [Candidatus Phytoplasma australasiaticum]MDO8046694.1 RluA family pseudouridine synthase [Candidatus Phytoplasma australasiaticum]
MIQKFIVTKNFNGYRLDYFVTIQIGFTKSQVQKLIANQKVLVNNNLAKKSAILKHQDVVMLNLTELIKKNNCLYPVNLNLEIVYEDDYLAVINKPANLIVHPSSSFQGITLVNGLLYQLKDFNKMPWNERMGIIHRLDKDTTGLILVGKTIEVVDKMQKMLQSRDVKRIYYALIEGFLNKSGTINLPIKRDYRNPLKMSVTSQGKIAITHFTTLKKFNNYSLVELQLETGRTHQIRVHLSYLKHPIIGDPLYNKKKYLVSSQLLHAKKLYFMHPWIGKELQFDIPLPNYFSEFIKFLE